MPWTIPAHEASAVEAIDRGLMEGDLGVLADVPEPSQSAEHQGRTVGLSVMSRIPTVDAAAFGVSELAEDNAEAFKMAQEAAAGGTLWIRPGTYRSTPFELVSGVRWSAYGATIRNVGSEVNSRLVVGSGIHDVTLEGLTVDGDKAAAPDTEQRHGIYLKACRNVTLRDVTSRNNKGDGLYLGRDSTGTPSSNVRGFSCDFDANHRQGMSITAAKDVQFFGSKFRNTAGTAPGAGVDLEPNGAIDYVGEVEFHGCDFTGNAGAGLIVSFPPGSAAKGPTVVGCDISGNAGHGGVVLSGVTGARFAVTKVGNNTRNGFYIVNGNAGLVMNGLEIRENGAAGIAFRYVNDLIRDSVITGALIVDNGQTASPRTGIHFSGATGGAEGITVTGSRIGNTDGGTSQDYGIHVANDRTTHLTLVGNDLRGNASQAAKLVAADLATFVIVGNQGLG